MGFHLLTGENIVPDIIGLVTGHIYYFLKDIYPLTSRKHYLNTP
jgi:hypothetical protein